MPNIQIPFGHWALSSVRANDSNGNAQFPGTLSATIDNYAAAYVAKGAPRAFGVVPKVSPPAGGFTTVSVTINGTSMDGTALPPITQAYDLEGPPAAPQAVVLTIAQTDDQVGNQPADPGSASTSIL